MLDKFFDFIYRRQRVWYKRFILKENPPWTEDAILQKYKFINIYRELDKCTLYLLEKLRDIKDREKILLNVIFYRFFNQCNLYENLGIDVLENIDKEKLISGFDKIKREGKPIFNNAYLISSGVKGQLKHFSILNFLYDLDIKSLIQKIDNSKSPEESFEALQVIPMVGPFLACEIWTDLSYLNFFKQNWTDNDFVNIGPGAKWGLEILFGRKLNKGEQKEKLEYLYKAQERFLENPNWRKIAYKNAFSNYPLLSRTNIEGSLCEFRKYWNIKSGRGKRRYFVPLNPD